MRRPRPPAPLEALPATYWSHLRRVCSPGRPDSLIDHVLVGTSGIYVIRYLPSELDRLDAATGRGRQHLHDVGVAACAEYAETISGLLPPRYGDRVRPVLCLLDADEWAEESGGTLVASLGTFEHIVRSSPRVLSTSEVDQAYSALKARLEQAPLSPGTSPRRFRATHRVVAASVGVAAAFIGVLVLGPETIELLGIRR
jgi:hypothetical protein